MGRDKLRIADVSRRTGLNRSTITALYKETTTRVDLPAIEQLCRLFNCSGRRPVRARAGQPRGDPMTLSAARWHVIAESNFAWEREALDWLRSQLPDRDPWHVWTNFEFIDDEGKVSEVDALVLSPAGLFLVEIKSRPGVLTGDAHSWTWTTDGRSNTVDNPLILANRKAKRLASLLKRQPAITKAKIRLPFVEPAIFLSSTSLSCRLEGLAKSGHLPARPPWHPRTIRHRRRAGQRHHQPRR
jgi:hypothetical protein